MFVVEHLTYEGMYYTIKRIYVAVLFSSTPAEQALIVIYYRPIRETEDTYGLEMTNSYQSTTTIRKQYICLF